MTPLDSPDPEAGSVPEREPRGVADSSDSSERATLPHLLVALAPSPELEEAIARTLPRTSWRYATRTAIGERGAVEAMLIGSVERQLDDFDSKTTPRLRFVQRIYTGLDGFAFDRFPAPIQVAGNVGGYGPFVAEHAVALALSAARALVPSNRQVAEGRLRPALPTSTLRGKTALVLGYGAIGREIAVRLSGFGVRVIGLNRSGRMGPGVAAMFPADRLEEALGEADLIFDVRPLTRASSGSLGPGEFARMRPEAIFVNVGRAGTVQEEALYRHLVEHPGFRAAMDPWWDEGFEDGRLGQRFPWTDLPNFSGTPHSAAGAPEARTYALDRALENLARFFRGEAPLHLAVREEYSD
jgi:phosphoglycerate dehydrogenase-like enzyme